jgi:para-nitrobenzyl esterase
MNCELCAKSKFKGVLTAVALATTILLCSIAVNAFYQNESGQTAAASQTDPVKTDSGYVSGTIIGGAGKEVRIFKGIPYAAPPVGNLRWKPPQPVTPWQGVKKCTSFGPFATQYEWTGAGWMSELKEAQMSEDCLHLNVLSPAQSAKPKLPVIVWLHDGGLDAGSGNRPIYNQPYLPQHGVVLVTVSHRIGGMGFVAHPGLAAESPNNAAGNYGMLDIIAALKWVKQNIAAFGGDPACVAIMGQSGGGPKVMWLLTSPLANGLFHRAIMEGGISGADGVTGSQRDVFAKAEAEKQGERLAAKLGVISIADLRARSWQEIVKALPAPRTQPTDNLKMRYAVDGWSMPDTPFNIASKGMAHSMPIMIGGGEAETSVHKGTAIYAPGLLKANPNLFVYVFSHLPTNWKKAGLKAFHGLELFYQFGGLDLEGERTSAVWLAPPDFPRDPGFDKNDDTMAENTMKIWAQFASTGNPSVEGLIKWPAFKMTPGEDKYMSIANPLEVKSGFLERFHQ